MIEFYTENDFQFPFEEAFREWIAAAVTGEGFTLGEIVYVFCDDEYLLNINQEFLKHDTYTDIITFDNTLGKLVSGEIYISTDRVAENAEVFNVSFLTELARVVIHGVLHLCGYKDKTKADEIAMRDRENYYLSILEVLSS